MAYYSDYNRKEVFNLTIEQYAKLLDISPRTLERYEYESKCPNHIKRLQDVIQCLFISYSYTTKTRDNISGFIEYYFNMLGVPNEKRFQYREQ